MIRECDWEMKDYCLDIRSPFSKFFLRENIESVDIITAVHEGSWFGILSVDIFTPENVAKRFRDINFGTIFEKLSVEKDMLSKVQQEHCKVKNKSFPLNPQLLRLKRFLTYR